MLSNIKILKDNFTIHPLVMEFNSITLFRWLKQVDDEACILLKLTLIV